jgi:hypothetical protein
MAHQTQANKLTAKDLLNEIQKCHKGISDLKNMVQDLNDKIDKIQSNPPGSTEPRDALSAFIGEDQYIQGVILELVPKKLLHIFEGSDKRCHGVGIPGHKNNLPFMEWCRVILKEYVYHTASIMSGQKKGEVLQKLARNMFRVMKSFNIHSPFPASVDFLQSRLDRKYTDWLKNEKKRGRENNDDGMNLISLLFFTS